MTEPTTPSPAPHGSQSPRDRISNMSRARQIVVGLVILYVILFIVLNTDRVDISFVFFTIRTVTLIALLVVAALSFGAGYFMRGRRSR